MESPHWSEPALAAALVGLACLQLPMISAAAAWVAIGLFPGRWIRIALGLGRELDDTGRLVLSAGLSLALAPLLLHPLFYLENGRGLRQFASGAALVALGAACVWLCRKRDRSAAHESNSLPSVAFAPTRGLRIVWLGLILLLVVPIVLTYWPAEFRDRVAPVLIHDYIKHHAVLFSLERHGLPLGNPFFADAAHDPVFYYHYFYLMPAWVRSLAGNPGIEFAFGAQAALVAVVTAGLSHLIVARFTGSHRAGLLAAVLTTVVGGFDIVPVVLQRSPAITLDTWADPLVRIHSLLTQMVWTPQNVQGLIVMQIAAIVASARGWWRGWLILGPLLIASLIGTTIWLAAAALPAAAVVVVIGLLSTPNGRERGRRTIASIAVGVAGLAISITQLLGYAETARRHGKGLTLEWPSHQSNALLGRLVSPGPLANLLDLPWVLMIELGPALVLVLLLPRAAWRRVLRDPGMLLFAISSVLAIAGFVTARSHFTYNDFGHKIMLATQLAAALIGAACVAQRRMSGQYWVILAAGLLLALPVGVFQTPLAALRRFVPLDGSLARIVSPLSVAAASESAAIRFLRDETPPDAVVQAHWGSERVELAQMIHRQIGVTILERDTHVFQGREGRLQEMAVDELKQALCGASPAVEVHAVLKRHGITHVLFGNVERKLWPAAATALADDRYFEQVHRSSADVHRLK